MQLGTMRSVALALAQTALGPSEADCCLLAALSQVGTVCTWSLSRSRGIQRLAYGEEDQTWVAGGRLDIVFRDALRKAQVIDYIY